jgi:hypothetical protein
VSRINLIRDLAHKLNRSLKIGDCPARLKGAIEAMKLPTGLYQLLLFSWVNKEGYVHGDYVLYTIRDIVGYRGLDRFLSEKMLPIGSAANGDPIVIRFDEENFEVGMLSHEEMHEVQNWADIYAQVVPTLEEFLLRIVDRLYLPIDSFAAKEYVSLREEMPPEPKRS